MSNIQLEHVEHKSTAKKYPLCFVAHDVDVPMNIGSLFRVADALGVEKIYLTGKSLTPPNTKIKKTSRSAEKYVSYTYEKESLPVVIRLKKLGYKIVSLEITSSSESLDNLSVPTDGKICLILGAEDRGVPQELLDLSDQTIHIPMLGANSSMNVATACAIATYDITRKIDNN